jgi:hypothetical protein
MRNGEAREIGQAVPAGEGGGGEGAILRNVRRYMCRLGVTTGLGIDGAGAGVYAPPFCCSHSHRGWACACLQQPTAARGTAHSTQHRTSTAQTPYEHRTSTVRDVRHPPHQSAGWFGPPALVAIKGGLYMQAI